MPKNTNPRMTFSLPPIREMLVTIRRAFDNKELQMFNGQSRQGLYSGPCAIGVCMTEEQREYGDDNEFSMYDINELVDCNIITGLTTEEISDLAVLQMEHESCSVFSKDPKTFNDVLSLLEKKYGAVL